MKTTIDCLNSIDRCIENYHIVVVDNASPDKSGKELKTIYQDNEKVDVILTDKNLGFAKGNNVGYNYLKSHFQCDFICVSNNDILLNDIEFEKKIERLYKMYMFDVLGPKIILKDCSVNSIRMDKPALARAQKDLIEMELLYFFSFIGADILAENALNLLKKLMKRSSTENLCNNQEHIEDVVLHGCFLIFSKKFFDIFDGFCPDTFLYHEEELLYLKEKQMNARIIYDTTISVVHLEDVSTNSIHKTALEKRRFKYHHEINSLKVLLGQLRK